MFHADGRQRVLNLVGQPAGQLHDLGILIIPKGATRAIQRKIQVLVSTDCFPAS